VGLKFIGGFRETNEERNPGSPAKNTMKPANAKTGKKIDGSK